MRRTLLPWSVTALLLAACGAPAAQVSTPPATVAPTQVPVAPTQVATAAAVATPTVAATPTAAAMSNEDIAEKLRPSTVLVLSQFAESAIDAEGLGGGTGIVYDKANGYLITNAHVVEGASAVKVALANSNRTRPARVVGRSQCDDLAVLKVDNTDGLEEATLGESSTLKAGAEVVALGYPESFELGNDLTVTNGSVSKLKAQRDKYEDLIQTNTAITHGNSGGPLVSRKGEVVGVNTLGFYTAKGEREPNINFAIAMSQAKPIVKELQAGKNRHYVGLNLYPNVFKSYYGTDEGMAIIGVQSGSPASQLGIQPADLLVKMEGSSVKTEEDVCNILRSHGDGEQIKVQVFRKSSGEVLEGEMTMGKIGASDEKTTKLQVVGNVAQGGGNQGGGQGGGNQETPAAKEPAATPAPAENAQAAESGFKPVVVSRFDSGAEDWPTGETEQFAGSVSGGQYVMDLKAPNQYLTSSPEKTNGLSDSAISSEVRIDGSTGFGGVMLRYKEDNDKRSLYVCWVNNAGKFGCSKDVDNKWTVLVAPKVDDVIKKNDVNRLTLVAIGNQIVFDVNDKQLASFNDDSLKSGGAGFYVENFEKALKVSYDNVAIGTP